VPLKSKETEGGGRGIAVARKGTQAEEEAYRSSRGPGQTVKEVNEKTKNRWPDTVRVLSRQMEKNISPTKKNKSTVAGSGAVIP